ncbi:Asp23/Gls24 family envelope stress response protein [Brevibacillus migulae]|uniref:Asp23/Gls24 family envelope stress response protein n=1 Tax=Brevibacillus migulae TaxID=1644114 RepID=UPI00106EC003|nr:Asp23/Gls24 family envelope stress response protein [Brevibacillus migulae]
MEEWNRGEIRVADGVVAVIAGLAAQEVTGIVLKAGNLYQDIAKRLTGAQQSGKNISVKVEEGEITLELRVGTRYGTKIDQACRELQKKVKADVEHLTGIPVVAVDVRVEFLA